MELTKNKIFFSILAFMLLIDILVAFNLELFYIRAVLAFLFITLIPGLLIMLMMKIRQVGFWEYLVYVVGLSVAFIMFAGLAVNWILPWLNITDKPLSTWPILICFNILLIAFWIIAYIRNKDLNPFQIKLPKFDALNSIMFIIPMFFPILAILGAFILNNHGPNWLTMIMLGGIAVYVFVIVLFRKRLNPNIYPWALYWIGLALLLMFSMRSWIFMGSDIVSEYHFFDLAIKNGIWDIVKYPYGYNVTLSITILPTILNIFINTGQTIIFKLILQLIFPIILIILYLFFKKFSTPLFSFLAGIFFISQMGYMLSMPGHIRQEIAFLFMALIFLILFNKKLKGAYKNLLIILFGVTLIVSHYSTGYVFLALFLSTILSIFLISIIFKKNKLFVKEIKKITFSLVLLFLVFSFLWYSQITPTSNNLVEFTSNSLDNFNDLFKEDSQIEGKSFLDQFKIKPSQKDRNLMLQKEIDLIKNKTNFKDTYSLEHSEKFKNRFMPQKTIPTKLPIIFSNIFYIFLGIIKKLGYVFIFIGLIYSLISSKIKNNSNLFLISLIGLIFFSFIVLITLIPFGSISYGVLRLYQQGLILFSVFAIVGTDLIFKKIKKNIRFILISLFLIIYFFSFAGFFNQIVGGNLAFPNLNNFGGIYDAQYISNTETSSIKWLSNEKITQKIYAGRHYKNPFESFGQLSYPDGNIFPQTLVKNSYVYSGNLEVFNEISFSYIQGELVGFNFPTKFLNNNKNKIYANSGSEVFK